MNLVPLAHSRTQKQFSQYLIAPSHALGLWGDNGAGKGYAATYLAAELLATEIMSLASHPYVLIIDALIQKTGIDDIRELQKFLTLTVPGRAVIRRVVIVEHIDILGHEAQNALLKTLEEPPLDTVVIVTYTRRANILPTIHSRLQSIQILPIPEIQARTYFNHHSTEEFNRAFIISGGLAGLLSALLQHQTSHPLSKAINQAREIIGVARYKRLGMVDKIIKNNEFSASLLLDGMYRLIDASYRQSLKTKSNKELQATVYRLQLLESAIDDLDKNVQAKLVMSRLFLEL